MDNLVEQASALVKDEKVFNKLSTKSKNLIEAYTEIFEDTEFEVIKKNNTFFFLGKDILKILGYSMDRRNISKALDKLNPNHCLPLNNLLSEKQKKKSQFTENELRRRYVNERGLHTLILKSNKKETERFQDFVLDLIDQAKSNALTEIKNAIAGKDDMILELIKKVDTMTISQSELKDQNKQLITSQSALKEHTSKIEKQNNQLMATNTKIEDQNRQLLQLCKKQDIKLDTIVDKLETNILPNRNIPPSDCDKQHKIAIIQCNNELYIIRAQMQYIDSKLKNEGTSLVYLSNCPNPIDFLNRLRELILNEELDADFTIKNNKIILNNTPLKRIKTIFDDLIQEQYEY